MNEKIIIQQNKQQLLNLIEALHFYKDNVIRPKYKDLINNQIESIALQLKVQNINILVNDCKAKFNFGDIVYYENNEAIIVGMSDDDEFIKIAVVNNNKFEIIDAPIVLINNN